MIKLILRKRKEEGGWTKNHSWFLTFIVICIFSSLVLHPSSIVYAAVPHLINYQGRLTDSSGAPLNGSYSLTFRIYDAETAGNLLWQGTYNGVVIQKGIFSVLLGGVNDAGYDFATLAFDKSYFLEIKVGNEVMSPRQRITSAGYAIRAEEAENANKLNGQQSSYYLDHGNMVGLGDNDHPQYAKGRDNNMRIDYGYINSVNGGQSVSVSFRFPFNAPPAVVIANARDLNNDEHGILSVYNVTTTGCTIKYNRPNQDGGPRPVYWIAVGSAE